MLDTLPDAMGVMLSRVSTGMLREPAPEGAVLDRIIQAGLCAPDHGRLRPFRFIAIKGDARARFADLCIAALMARDPDATEAEVARMRGKLTQPPLILALGVHITPAHKVPEIEQVMAVSAAAMNILNAAHAMGFAGKWVTGPNSYDPAISKALGVDQLAGFLYLGTPAEPITPARRPEVASHLTEWVG
jgi:nitroreductase